MIQPLWRTVWRFLKKLKIEPGFEHRNFSPYGGKVLNEMGFNTSGFQQDPGHMSSVPLELSLLIYYIWELSEMTSEDLWVPKL